MWYDVKYITAEDKHQFFGNPPEIVFVFKYQKIAAKSAAEALDTFGNDARMFQNTQLMDIANKPVATPLKHEWDTRDKEYWREKWNESLVRMPTKTKRSFSTMWVTLPVGTTPLPRLIEGRAKGTMRMDGHFVEQLVSWISHKYAYGQIAALAIILGYITTDGKATKRPRANCCALQGRKIPEASRPRDPKVRRLLAALPTMGKDEIKELLDQKREAMKHREPDDMDGYEWEEITYARPTIPDFIEARAKGEMKMEGGKLYQKVLKHEDDYEYHDDYWDYEAESYDGSLWER